MEKVFKGSILKIVSAIVVIIGVSFLGSKPAFASTMHYVSNDGWWASGSGSFDANKVTGRVVSGHFQGKDKPEGVAAFYDCGNNTTKLIVWNSTGNSFTHVDSFDWTSGVGSFDASKITGRVVVGDFNGDGYDDIAVFYDYGNSTTRMLVWLSNGSSFTHVDSFDWVSGTGSFDANRITGRVVAGDFTGDGRDDVAVFYDCGNTSTKLMVFQSTGSSFTHNNNFDWVTGNSYDANKLTGRVVAGYFQGKGRPEGIAAFYDYGGGTSRIHTWLSSGSSFSYASNGGWWQSGSGAFDANKITGRVVAGDFTGTGRDDISVFYDLGNSSTREYMFQSTGSSFIHNDSFDWVTGNSYNANNLTGRVVAGHFQGPNNPAGIAGFYDYGGATTRIHVWLSDAVPTPSQTKGQQVVDYAEQFLGVPYVWGGDNPSGFDCSGFTMYVYQHFGVSLPHYADSQKNYGTYVPISQLQPGDLLCFDWEPDGEVDHVGIYIGNNKFIQAHGSRKNPDKVIISDLDSYHTSRLATQRRLVY